MFLTLKLNTMNEKDFRVRLSKRQEKVQSFLCVGLDPDINEMPDSLKKDLNLSSDSDIAVSTMNWMIKIVDATAPFTSMYKPQIAHWEALGTAGMSALSMTVRHIKEKYPDIPVFLDCKRGDIDNTQTKYRVACFEKYGVDGMNFSPYMGKSCMKALYDENHPERALVGLCFTSNSDARQTQNIQLASGDFYWEYIAKCTLGWAEELGPGALNNAGLVMAAAYENKDQPGIIHSEHLLSCRKIVGNKFWFLIPGIGKQGGLLKETIQASFIGYGTIAINESRSVIFASKGEDFALVAGKVAEKSRNSMREALSEF